MIINVRLCDYKPNIIVSNLLENKEKDGYSSLKSERFILKDQSEILTLIRKTLILNRGNATINADKFIPMLDGISRKNLSETSLTKMTNTINEMCTKPNTRSLSQVYFNNKPLSRIKFINIINDNMYFMIKKKSVYNLELIKNQGIMCMIPLSNLVTLYRQIKHKPVKQPTFCQEPQTANYTDSTVSASEFFGTTGRCINRAVNIPRNVWNVAGTERPRSEPITINNDEIEILNTFRDEPSCDF